MHLFCTCTRTRSVSAPIYSYIHDALTRFMNNVVVAVAAAAHYVTFVWYFFFMFIQMLQRKHLCNRRHSNPMPATAIAKSLTHTTHTHTHMMHGVYMRFVCVICNAKPNDLGRFVYVQFFAVNDLGEFIRRPYLSRSSTYSAFVSEYENKKLHTLIVATVSHISFLIATRHFRYWCIVVVVVVVVVRESDRIEKFAIHETTAEHSVRHIRRELIFIKQS